MSLNDALRERAELCPRQAEVTSAPSIKWPIAVPAVAEESRNWVIATFAIASSAPLLLTQDVGMVYETQTKDTHTLRFKPSEVSSQFRDNLDRALELIRLEIKSNFAHILMLDAAALDAGLAEHRRATPRSTRVDVTVFSQSDVMANLKLAKQEVAPATRISVNLPVNLNPTRLQQRLSILMEATRRALKRESGLHL